LPGDLRERTKEVFEEIYIDHDFEIETLEIGEDHVPIFLSFPPRDSISKVVGMFKSISASVIIREHPEVKRELWGEEFCEAE
jgi:putative transposase